MSTADDLIKDQSVLSEKLAAFSDLLDDIPSLDTKLRVIWEEVYQNAIKDREAANIQMLALINGAQGGATYALQLETAPAIVKYLERMAKSTDQLLDLARRIEAHVDDADEFDENSLYDDINTHD